MKNGLMIAMIAALHLVPCGYSQEPSPRSENRRLHRVSLIRVIANPRDYDGENIRVVGYLAGAGLDYGLGVFVSESDGVNGIFTNAIDIDSSQRNIRSLVGKYVIVSGVYHAPAPGGDFNGYIDHILEVKPLKH